MREANLSEADAQPERLNRKNPKDQSGQNPALRPRDYVGMWITADGRIRQELLPNGRYDEARGNRQSAYTGSYRIAGNRIDYADDSGFTADGEFREDVLYHAGLIFYRQPHN